MYRDSEHRLLYLIPSETCVIAMSNQNGSSKSRKRILIILFLLLGLLIIFLPFCIYASFLSQSNASLPDSTPTPTPTSLPALTTTPDQDQTPTPTPTTQTPTPTLTQIPPQNVIPEVPAGPISIIVAIAAAFGVYYGTTKRKGLASNKISI